MSFLEKILEKDLDLSKKTHPNKSYREHVKECREVFGEMMKIYRYPQELIKLALLLCDVHDVGKLLDTWDLAQKRRPWHSIEGAEWFMDINSTELGMDPIHQRLIAYMIASHHSPLYVPVKFKDIIAEAERRCSRKYYKCRELAEKINDSIKLIDEETRYNLADILGIVKIADIISAKGLPIDRVLMNYRWPEELGKKIEEGIIKRAHEKRGMFDQEKFEKQKAIAFSEGKHLLVAAPTGWGKTALATLRMVSKSPVKIFYVLPTITAIKDFYESFSKILDKNYIGEYFYFADVELLKNTGEEEHPLDIYRYFIPKITITTIDQLLLTTLQAGKYYVRRFNLRDSLIIIDEFHLLTPEMIACTRVSVRNLLRSYNFSCLFMSATPSPIYEELLKEVIPQMKTIILSDEYRRLKRHKIDNIHDRSVEELIFEKEDLFDKGRVLIIVNTVNEAQHIYTILKERFNGKKKTTLIHGDFAYKDRVEKEKQIDKADILISTQVAEVSLDISFDKLITELAPIPSLIQRFGRVNRYGKIAGETNIYICKCKSDKPYGSLMLQESRRILPSLLDKIEKHGEMAYLDKELWSYEEIYEETVMKIEDKILKKLNDFLLNFFSFLAREEEILEFLGRERTWLAVPEIYLNDILVLYRKLKNIDNYEERANIYAQIKEHFVPALYSDIKGKNAEWNDELRLWVIKNYDKDLGIVRVNRP